MENMKQGKYSNGVFFKLFSLSHSILFLRSYRVIRVLPPLLLPIIYAGCIWAYGVHMGCFPRFYALIPITLLPKPGHRHHLGILFFFFSLSLYLNGMWTF